MLAFSLNIKKRKPSYSVDSDNTQSQTAVFYEIDLYQLLVVFRVVELSIVTDFYTFVRFSFDRIALILSMTMYFIKVLNDTKIDLKSHFYRCRLYI